MPLLLIAALGGGALGGFTLGKGVEGVSNTTKWLVIGGISFFAARYMKII